MGNYGLNRYGFSIHFRPAGNGEKRVNTSIHADFVEPNPTLVGKSVNTQAPVNCTKFGLQQGVALTITLPT